MRISVTDLDGFRYFKATEAMDKEQFIARMRRQEPPTQAMLAGKALHAILEHAHEQEMETAERDGFRFRFAGDFELSLPAVRELKGEMSIPTHHGLVTLVGIVDGLDGTIYDHKLSARFDAERYADSFQWRAYLAMFGARRFVYNVFEGKEQDGEWLVYGLHQFPLYAYYEMGDEVRKEVGELAGFIAQYLPERV